MNNESLFIEDEVNKSTASYGDEVPIQVFVHLGYTLDAKKWAIDYMAGKVPDKSPYGCHHAEEYGCRVTFSEKKGIEGKIMNVIRRGLGKIFGFDFIHAWRNREEIFLNDIVWAYTEREHLAVELLFLLLFYRKKRPKLIAQSIWLLDEWGKFSWVRKALYKKLLEKANILTFLAPENHKMAKKLGLSAQCRKLKLGVSVDSFPLAKIDHALNSPVRIVSLGNDKMRDWLTLVEAVSGQPNLFLNIVSQNCPKNLGSVNVAIIDNATFPEMKELYAWADIVVIPSKINYYGSGATVLLEAVISGVPVICSDSDSNREYFDEDEVRYVAPKNAVAIREAILELAHNPQKRTEMAEMARARFLRDDYSTKNYMRNHFEMSKELLNQKSAT